MPTDETNGYYEGRRLAAVAMSQAAGAPWIQKMHLERAHRYAILAAASTTEAELSSRANDAELGL